MLMMSEVEKRVDFETAVIVPGGREGRAASHRDWVRCGDQAIMFMLNTCAICACAFRFQFEVEFEDQSV